MTTPTIVGNANGIKLWNIMSTSDDKEEQAYFIRLNNAAAKYGKICFSDCITQRRTKQNQVTWMMIWDGTNWEISNFLKPRSALEITERMKQLAIQKIEEVTKVDVNDLL